MLSHKELLKQPPFTFQVLFSVRGERGAVDLQAINCELIVKAQSEKWLTFSPCGQKEQKGVCWSQNAAALTGSICEKDITQGQPCELGRVRFLSNFIFLQWTPVNDGDETQPHISSVTDKKQQGAKHRLPASSVPWLPHVGGLCSLFLSPHPPEKQ